MPEVNHTTPLPGLKYELVSWGEIITGTKEQLQALGIGAGSTFPGEPGGPKRQITVRDPRGLPTRINLEPIFLSWIFKNCCKLNAGAGWRTKREVTQWVRGSLSKKHW